jgi:hypothetical protein
VPPSQDSRRHSVVIAALSVAGECRDVCTSAREWCGGKRVRCGSGRADLVCHIRNMPRCRRVDLLVGLTVLPLRVLCYDASGGKELDVVVMESAVGKMRARCVDGYVL